MADSKWLLSEAQATGASEALYLNEEAVGVLVQLSGTFEATVQFEASLDGTNFDAVGLVPLGANTTRTSTATAAGLFAGMLPGATKARVNVTEYSSGKVSAYAHALLPGDKMPTEIVAALTNANIAAAAGIAGSKLATEARLHVTPPTEVMDLSGTAVPDTIWWHAPVACTIEGLWAVYVEAASDDDGVVIEVGKQGDGDYFATYTTKKSATANEREALTLLKTAVAAGDTITYNCAGSKSGDGSCFLVMAYTVDDAA
jgi:hypothetical protein